MGLVKANPRQRVSDHKTILVLLVNKRKLYLGLVTLLLFKLLSRNSSFISRFTTLLKNFQKHWNGAKRKKAAMLL